MNKCSNQSVQLTLPSSKHLPGLEVKVPMQIINEWLAPWRIQWECFLNELPRSFSEEKNPNELTYRHFHIFVVISLKILKYNLTEQASLCNQTHIIMLFISYNISLDNPKSSQYYKIDLSYFLHNGNLSQKIDYRGQVK